MSVTSAAGTVISPSRRATARLRALDPLAKLSGGYGYITKQGRTVSSVREVSMGDVLTIRVCDGTVQAVVEQVSENEESR